MSDSENDVYGGYFPKARSQAILRSQGKCQFCGIREAREAHHWAYPRSNYPSGEKVQNQDLTALCKPCHELAGLVRNWVGEKGANFDQIAGELENAKNFYKKRQAFSRWFFPDEGEIPTPTPVPNAKADALDDYVPSQKLLSIDSSQKVNEGRPYLFRWLILAVIVFALVASYTAQNPDWLSHINIFGLKFITMFPARKDYS